MKRLQIRQGLRQFKTRVGRAPSSISSIRGALIAGFMVLLSVWTFAGYELIRSLGDVEQRVMAEHTAFAQAGDAVSLIRRSVLEASINVRDALIDADRVMRDSYRSDLRALRDVTQRRVDEYV